MRFMAAHISLVIPLCGTAALGSKKPKRVLGGMILFTIDYFPCQLNFGFTRPLVEITLYCRFKPAWPLKYHVTQIAYILEVKAV